MTELSLDQGRCRQAHRADIATVAAALADAFQDEPAFCFFEPDANRRKALLARAFPVFVAQDIRVGHAIMTGGGEAATLWRLPGQAKDSGWETLRTGLPFFHAFGGTIGRALHVGDLIKANLPEGEFWYLHFAGCRLADRGKGLGGKAIRAGLALADASGSRAYLETADANNVPIYRALGFDVTHSWQVPDGPQFWGMMRAPR